jgi:phospholipase/carboxylesterase
MQCPIEWLPAGGTPPEQLILLLHGWGGNGTDMAPLAQALRQRFPQAAVLAPTAPHPHAKGGLRHQWYSIDDLSPANWAERAAAPLPALHAWVQQAQQRTGVGPAATCLGGFSQGAILALALALQHDGICGRVLAFAGCLTAKPTAAPRHSTLHLFHGSDDDTIPADGSRQALAWIDQLRGDATLDIAQGIGHELHPALIDCAMHRLQSHIPLRTWQAALGAVPAPGAGREDH